MHRKRKEKAEAELRGLSVVASASPSFAGGAAEE
jgi:hypothetical protein